MKYLFSVIVAILTLSNVHSQELSQDEILQQMQILINKHISINASSVSHITLTINGSMLDKETHLIDGESHHKKFELTGASFSLDKLEIEKEAREFYDYKKYWDVHINNSWIATEVSKKKDADRLIELLILLQKTL